MKLKKNFILRQVADTWVVLPLAEATVDFSAVMTLNGSGALLWQTLEQGADRDGLVAALTAEYEVDTQEAADDVDAFLEKLARIGCIE